MPTIKYRLAVFALSLPPTPAFLCGHTGRLAAAWAVKGAAFHQVRGGGGVGGGRKTKGCCVLHLKPLEGKGAKEWPLGAASF